MRLDGRKYIQSMKSAWLFKHSELKARVLSACLKWNNKGHNMNKHTQTHTDVHTQAPSFNFQRSEPWKGFKED